jgi:hypothetical protein
MFEYAYIRLCFGMNNFILIANLWDKLNNQYCYEDVIWYLSYFMLYALNYAIELFICPKLFIIFDVNNYITFHVSDL